MLAFWPLSRALRQIADVCSGLSRVGQGDYTARMRGPVPAEFEPLRRGFNSMAERLAEAEAVNKSLTKQLVNLQEEERAEIARDLHDDIGPFLFATGTDATMIRQFIATSDLASAQARSEAIVESVSHMHKHLRSILGRLRPGTLIDLGLDHAIGELIGFWRTRRPKINFAVDEPVPSLGRPADDVIFRVVQESLSNAVRHAKPSNIRVSIFTRGETAQVEIADDGIGFEAANQHAGFGLSGMQERVASAGGQLVVSSNADGTVVSVQIPLREATTDPTDDLVASESS
jgi:two-component system, NarL family, sensor histidine kinase UhpB